MKQPAQNRPSFVRRLGWLTAFVLAVLLLGAFLYVSPQPKVISDSNVYHSSSTYQQSTMALMGGLSDHTKLSFNSNELALKLKKQFPEISQVSVELPLFSSHPRVHLHIGPPAFVVVSGAKHLILNSQGVVVAEPSTQAALSSKLLTIQDQGRPNLSSGSQVLGVRELDFINQVVSQVKHARVSISELVLPHEAEELDLHPASADYYVKFYLGGDAMVEAGQYLAARHHFQASNIQPKQYVDVRVTGKIFYK